MKKFSIKRLSTIYIVFVVLLITVLCISGYCVAYFRLVRTINTSNNAVLGQIILNVDNMLYSSDQTSKAMLNDYSVLQFYSRKNADDADPYFYFGLQQAISDYIIDKQFIHSVYLYSENTRQILTPSTLTTVDKFHDLGWLEAYQKLEKQAYCWIGGHEVSPDPKLTPTSVLTLVRNVPVTAGSLYPGALVINIDTRIFNNIFDKDEFSSFQDLIVTTGGNTLIYAADETLYKDFADIFEEMRTKDLSVTSSSRKQIYRAASGQTQWNYYSVIPSGQIKGQLYLMGLFIFLIGLAMSVLAIYILRSLRRASLDPLDRFIGSISSYASENLNENTSDLDALYAGIISSSEKMRQQIADSLPAIRWRLLIDILNGNKNDFSSIESYLHTISADLYPENYAVMILKLDNYKELLYTQSNTGIHLYVDSICSDAESLMNGDGMKSIAVKMPDDTVICLVSFAEMQVSENMMSLLSSAETLRVKFRDRFNITMSVGIGGLYVNLSDVCQSYQEASLVLQYTFILGTDTVITIEDIRPGDFENIDMINQRVSRLRTIKTDGLYSAVEEIFDLLYQQQTTPEIARQIAVQIIMNIFYAVSNQEVQKHVLQKKKYHNLYYSVNQFSTLEEIRSYTLDLLDTITEDLQTLPESKQDNQLAEQMLEYIDAHYTESDISLNAIADELHTSIFTLSRIFKEYTGKNFVDCLITKRMELAKKLLAETDKKIAVISEELGYTTATSFMRIFKRYTGVTPSEYRRANQSK